MYIYLIQVVQHYNSLLCLSKINNAADGVILFENEVIKDLCNSMRCIARPTLYDINQTLSSNILPIILPKYRPDGRFSGFDKDIYQLCSHSDYKLLDIKLTPQTSEKSIEFTFDSWR